jgi:hypothetical protein
MRALGALDMPTLPPSHIGSYSPRLLVPVGQSFPILLDVKGPLELQVGVLVIVDELGHGFVVATAEHTRGGGFGLDCGMSGEVHARSLLYVHFFS